MLDSIRVKCTKSKVMSSKMYMLQNTFCKHSSQFNLFTEPTPMTGKIGKIYKRCTQVALHKVGVLESNMQQMNNSKIYCKLYIGVCKQTSLACRCQVGFLFTKHLQQYRGCSYEENN